MVVSSFIIKASIYLLFMTNIGLNQPAVFELTTKERNLECFLKTAKYMIEKYRGIG